MGFLLSFIVTTYLFAFALIPLGFEAELMKRFPTSPSSISYAMTIYSYTLILFGIPIGILVDRYLHHFSLVLGPLFSALGALFFTLPHFLIGGIGSRLLMGVGASTGFSYGMKLIMTFFPEKVRDKWGVAFFALSFFFVFLFTLLSNQLLVFFHWDKYFYYYAAAGFCLSALSLPIAWKLSKHHFPSPLSNVDCSLRKLFDSSQIWFIGIGSGIFLGVLYAFTIKWMPLFFEAVYEISSLAGKFCTALFWSGMLLGSFFFSYISDSLGKKKMFIPWGIFTALLMLILIIYPPYLSFASMVSICFLCGFGSSVAFLGITILCRQSPAEWIGAATASLMTFFSFAIAFTDPLITLFLRLENIIHQGKESLDAHKFQISLFRIPIYIGVSLLLSFFIREKPLHKESSSKETNQNNLS